MNATAEKFGYPNTVIKEYQHWLVLVRPQQVTLGSLVLVCKESVTRFSDVSTAAFTELHEVIAAIESTLRELYGYQKMNYLMLMMVDPDVHYHVIPRYDSPCSFSGKQVVDHGWPAAPALAEFVEFDGQAQVELVAELQKAWR
ncbi:MAG: HIT family protein [Pseudomonadales bacterium]|jgi:diadenosine tetraphosphate (Ap4A) HIT family hydrolase